MFRSTITYVTTWHFFPRKVIVYRELSQGAISFLGLSRNDETTNSLKTSHFEELKIMRKLLYSKHGGKFSNRYQDDIYQLFNALVSFLL